MSKYHSMEEESPDFPQNQDADASSNSAATLEVTKTSTANQAPIDIVRYEEPPSVQYADPMKFTPGRKEHSVQFTDINTAYHPAYAENNTPPATAETRAHEPQGGAPRAAYHVTANGNVVKEGVVVTHADGTRFVRTDNGVHWSDFRHALKERHLKYYLIGSVICMVLFFPTGIPAFVFARATKTHFYKGIEQGNLDAAKSYAKKTERLMVLTGVVALLIAVLVLALLESHPVEQLGTIG